MAGAQSHARCEAGNVVCQAGMGRDPALYFLQAGSAHWGCLASATELQLTAGALEEHHQLRCHSQSDFASEVLLYKRESEVQPGGDAGGGPNTSVTYVNGVRVDGHLRKGLCEALGNRPVCGHSAAIQQAGGREYEGAAADGAIASQVRGGLAEPFENAGVRRYIRGVRAACDQQGVEFLATAAFADRGVGQESDAGGAADRAGTAGDDLQPVGWGGLPL
jgi:hypothetical protein